MSVTFRVDPGRTLGYRATHVCGATGTVVFPTAEAGLVAASTGEVPGCVDSSASGRPAGFKLTAAFCVRPRRRPEHSHVA